jgi:hypothetical protein
MLPSTNKVQEYLTPLFYLDFTRVGIENIVKVKPNFTTLWQSFNTLH